MCNFCVDCPSPNILLKKRNTAVIRCSTVERTSWGKGQNSECRHAKLCEDARCTVQAVNNSLLGLVLGGVMGVSSKNCNASELLDGESSW